MAVPGVLTADASEALASLIAPARAGRAGTRNLLAEPWCAALAGQLRRHAALAPLLAKASRAVQCTYFEKSATQNWLVAMHQDLSIPVAARVVAAECQGWSEKEGELFVQPPVALLEQLVAVRLHLDNCGTEDGPLRVLPRSHRCGLITPERTAAMRGEGHEVVCTARRGDALALRPLLLHASSKASGTSRRRVLHFLFGPQDLPHGLAWRHAV